MKGNLMSDDTTKGNKINWAFVVLGAIVCVGLYLIPSPLTTNHTIVSTITDTVYYSIGSPDTIHTNVSPVHGHQASVISPKPIINNSGETDDYNYYFYAELKDSTKEGDKIYIQSYTYPYEENDSLKARTIIDYELTPRPLAEITKTDTVFIKKYIQMESTEVPFYEEPVFVATTTTAVLLTIVYLVSRLK